MNYKEYINRIRYSGELKPSIKVLHNLQRSHLLRVPFENLDIHYGIPLELDVNKIFEKIVLKKRGGFCYELNGLFFDLLSTIGFDAKRVSGRVYDEKKSYGQEYDHLAIIVNINGTEYLTDVGFGEFTFAPLKLKLETIQNDERGEYVIDKYDKEYFRVSKIQKNELLPKYIFKNIHREFKEFSGMCTYHQTNSKSHFTQKKLITLPTGTGRITLTTDKLKITKHNKTEEVHLKNEASFEKELWNYFKINKPAANTK